MKKILVILHLFLIVNYCFSQKDDKTIRIEKETFIYSIKENDTLRLDKYEIPEISTPKACIIFVFGGGFSNGSRDNAENSDFMIELAKKGYTGIAIDYRLGMKNIQLNNPMEIASTLVNSISMAVEDLYDATNFVYNHSDNWNINKEWIIACGSSAGAITVLQSEYWLCTNHNLTQKLPKQFRYGGIISFAGATLKSSEDKKLITKPSPIQLFHGDSDSNVPYNKLELGPMGLYGSLYISEQLNKMNSPYYFYQVNNAAHEVASLPMKNNLNDIDSFIQKMIFQKQNTIIHTIVDQIGAEEMKKDFTIIDYIKSNYQ